MSVGSLFDVLSFVNPRESLKDGSIPLCLVLFFQGVVQGQPYYQRAFGGLLNDRVYAICATEDNAVILGGMTGSFVAGTNADDLYLTRIHRSGEMQWSRHYDCGIVSWALDLATCSHGSIMVAGGRKPTSGILLRVDSLGDVDWAYTGAVQRYTAVCVGIDEMVYALGYTVGTNSDIQLDKFRADGTLLWSKRYGTSNAEVTGGVSPTADGGAIVACSTLVAGSGVDGLLMKVDGDGDIEWSRTFGLAAAEEFHDVKEIATGGYVAVGATSGGPALAIRVNNVGDTLWTRVFDGGIGSCRFRTVQEVNQGFLISGEFCSGSCYPLLVLLDDAGNLVWQRRLNGWNIMPTEPGLHAQFTDGSLALTSSVADTGPGSRDICMAVLDGQGMGADCELATEVMNTLSPTWYLGVQGEALGAGGVSPLMPTANPAATLLENICGNVGLAERAPITTDLVIDAGSGTVAMQSLPSQGTVSLYNGLGQELESWRVQSASLSITLAGKSSGLFLVTVLDKYGRLLATYRVAAVH
ncbi:MAG: hypothetical protein IPM12_15615 [Flavobacteriales bacterium]|nr:hypothetical protein [Flavobacteriales bacterium]